MDKFKALRALQNGDATEQAIEMISLDDLSPGQVTFRVEYSSVNYKDALAATGLGHIIRDFPRVPGIDAAGEVVASDSDRFKPGDAILVTGFDFGTLHDGGFAEFARVPAEWCVLRPDGMSAFDAMALGTAGIYSGFVYSAYGTERPASEQGPYLWLPVPQVGLAASRLICCHRKVTRWWPFPENHLSTNI